VPIKHLVIPDTQCKPDVPLDHFTALGNYIVEKQPDVIVHIGDHWDLPSLSSYDVGKAGFDQRDYLADIQAGNHAMNLLTAPMNAYNKRRKTPYKPRMVYLMGNHCYRVIRATQSAEDARYRNVITPAHFNLTGWKVHPFLQIVEINGISYCHYFQQKGTGRAIGGTAKNKLTKLKFSYVQGHVQDKDSAQEYLLNGRVIRGLMAGAFYQHDEEYLGQCNAHWRGVHMLHEVKNGDYDHLEISLGFLRGKYL
jgi:hypothetical protein